LSTPAEIPGRVRPVPLWFRRNGKWILALVLAGLVVSRFNLHLGYIDDDKRQTAKLIEQFHERMNTGQFDEIYADAHPAFRKSLTAQEWLHHMADAREQYGKFETMRSSRFNVIMGAPVQIRAAYTSTFEKGEATELFSFAREGNKVQLLIYGISPNGIRFGSSGPGSKAQ
jgi:hypothetical protein